MLKRIVIGGLISALLLLLISWLISLLNIEFLSVTLHAQFWPIIIVALVLGIINALLVPLVMKLFKKAKGWLLFVITLIVDAAALLLAAHLTPALYIGNWWTAVIIAAILSVVSPIIYGLFEKKSS